MKIALTILIMVAIVAAVTFIPYVLGRLVLGWKDNNDISDIVDCWFIGLLSSGLLSFISLVLFELAQLIYNEL